MKRKVMITVRGGESSYTVPGTMEETAAGFTLFYREPEALGLGAAETALTLSEHRALLKRSGAVRCVFRFEEGARHSTVYETPLGSFPAELVTHSLRARLSGRGGVADIRYSLTLGGAASERRLRILVRTEEER